MSRPGPFKLMVKNWKISIVGVPAFSFALFYGYDYTTTRALMRNSCSRATIYGDEKIRNPTAPTRHITVILNPTAGRGKSKKLYEKWVEPLLHLSGIKVSLVETRSPKEAYELMKIMSNCDGVAIVGGDGTVHEAINGLLHRKDRARATKEFPIGIIPTGQYNSIARYLHQNFVSYRNQKEFVIGATVKLIDSTTTKFDALKITPLDEELKSKEEPLYAARDVRYGLYQDNFFKLSGYYQYQTYVRPIWQRLQRIFSSKYSLPQIESVSYTEPCIGCSKCSERHRLTDESTAVQTREPSGNRKWWSMFAPVGGLSNVPSEEEKRELELSKRENEDCGIWIEVSNPKEISDFRACMMGDKMVRMSLGRNKEYTLLDVTETQDVRLKLNKDLDEQMKRQMDASQIAVNSQKEDESMTKDGNLEVEANNEPKKTDTEDAKPVQFLVDGQPLQARSIEITSISKAITLFTGPYKPVYPKAKNQ